MRFLFFSAQYLPTTGGVEQYTHHLAKTLVGMGHAAGVATSALPGLPEQEQTEEGIDIFRLPAYLYLNSRFPTPRFSAGFRRMAAALWQQKPDFVVINTRFYPLSLWAAKQCRRRGIPAIVIEHGTKHLSLDSAFLNIFGNAFEHIAMRLMRRRCNHFYGVSLACNAWLRHFHVTAEGVLYNAVDAAALQQIAAASPCLFRERLSLGESTPLVVFIGRFIAEKGVPELLKAFGALRTLQPQATLVMVGTGPLFSAVQAQQTPGVILAGTLPHDECVALMAQSDVFCLPTVSEGFSSTVLEAAAVGTCIVTTPTGGSTELIEDGISGILLPDRRPQTICDALARTLADTTFRQAAGKLAQQAVCERFTWENTATTLLTIAETSIPANG